MENITFNSWDRVHRETFKIKYISNFQSVEDWVAFHENPRNASFKGNGRRQCSMCFRNWKDIKYGNVWICIMHKRTNQCICDDCVKNFDKLIVKRNRV